VRRRGNRCRGARERIDSGAGRRCYRHQRLAGVTTSADGDGSIRAFIGFIVSYDIQDGLDFFLLHELGHSTPGGVSAAGANSASGETYANDVCWALAIYNHWDRYQLDPTTHYSTTPPEFLPPNGGGSGGPRNPGSEVPDPDGPPPPVIWAIVDNGDMILA